LAQAPPPSGGNTPPTQSNITNLPNDFPSPAHPWYGPFDPKRGNYGAVVRQLEVPARQVVIQVYVPRPGSLPGEFQRQVAEIPGYVVTETTTGYLYPERWSLQQQTAGVYQWVRLPPAFQRK
jgi:hypothetical protein